MRYKTLLLALFCSCQVLAMEPEDPVSYKRAKLKELNKFKKRNFQMEVETYEIEIELPNNTSIIKKIPCPFYTPILFKETNVGDKLLRYIQAYPMDRELAAMYARWLEKSSLGVNFYVIDWLARAVLIAYDDATEIGPFFLYKYTHEYVDRLSAIQWQRIDLTPHLRNISMFCHQKEDFITTNKIKFKNKNQYNAIIENTFIEECDFVLTFLNSKPKELSQICSYESEKPSAWFDAFFIFLITKLNQSDNGFIIKKLSKALYDKREKTFCPPSLKLTYADYYLGSTKQYEEACSLYKSVLDANEDIDQKGYDFFHTSEHYNKLSGYLLGMGQNEEALQSAKKALILNQSPLNQWNVAFGNILCECFNDDVLQDLKRIVEMPREEKKKHGLSHKIATSSYPYALYRAGKTEELTEFLLSKQNAALEKAFETEKERWAFVKSGVMAQQSQEKKKQKQKKKQKAAKQLSTPSKVRMTSTTEVTSTVARDNASYSTEKYVALPEKVKKKTRGTPYEQKTNGQIEQKGPEQTVLFKCITDLTSNKHAWKTFNKLFEIYPKKSLEDPICFTDATISLTEINWLFKALAKSKDANATPDSAKEKKTQTGIDISRGKGSHKVATVDLGEDMEKTVLTLTNAAKLKEYQIERLRNAFIKAGVFPDNPDIIEQLKAIKRAMDLDL